MHKLLLLLALTATPAFASIEGEYRCKNKAGIPDSVYKITNLPVSSGGPELPYLEIERNFRQSENSPLEQSRIRGWGTEITYGNVTTLMIAALRLEFVSGVLAGCQKN